MADPKATIEPDPGVQRELVRSTHWLLTLRWAPAVALATLPWLAPVVPSLAIKPWPLSACGLVLLGVNALLHALYQRWVGRHTPDQAGVQIRRARLLMGLQIAFDWITTFVALHYTGGVISPLLVLLLVHIAITSVLLPRRECLLLALTAVVTVLALGFAHGSGLVAWHPLVVDQAPPGTWMIVAGGGCFSLVALSLAWLASTLSLRLSKRGQVIQKLSRNLETAYNQLMAQYSLIRTSTSTLDLEELLAALTQRVARTLGARACLVHLKEDGGSWLHFAAGHVEDDDGSELEKIPRMGGLFARIFDGQPTFVEDTAAVDDPWTRRLHRAGWCSAAGAPIRGRKGTIGVLWTACRTCTKLGEDDARFLEAAGTQVGVAIENAIAYTSMQELDRRKTQFVNIVTHELRSPVAVTLSLLDVLASGCAGELTPKQTELLTRAKNRTMFLRTLVNDLLAMAEAKALPETPAGGGRTDLGELVRRIYKRHETQAQGKEQAYRLRVEGEGACRVAAAPDTLDRILTNLIGNAIKYTPAAGRVEVELRPDDGHHLVRVVDTGIGIPAEALPRLGQDFYRAPNARKVEPTGTGLGLAITTNLVKSLGGTLDIESVEGRGSTFTLRLPAC